MDSLKISPNFTFRESIFSQTGVNAGIFNYPNEEEFQNILKTAVEMELVRAVLFGQPLEITSWFRNSSVNKLVGGSTNSDHMTGSAVDFKCFGFGTPVVICQKLIERKESLPFKQLILESSWVHISFDHSLPNTSPKHEVLTLLRGGNYAKGLTDIYGKII